jgi:hypothetical protein
MENNSINKIKYINHYLFFFLFFWVKSLVRILILKINEYHQDQKNFDVVKILKD